MGWLVIVVSLSLAKHGDTDYLEPTQSAQEILDQLDVDPQVLEHLLDHLKPTIKTLSRPVWMFHKQAMKYMDPKIQEGGLGAFDPAHQDYAQTRIRDFFHNAEYGRSSAFGSGFYLAPNPGAFYAPGAYRVALEVRKGARFLDLRSQLARNPLSQEALLALSKASCHFRPNFHALLLGPERCRAIALAFLQASGVDFILYPYGGINVPKGCDSEFSFVMTNLKEVGRYFGRSASPRYETEAEDLAAVFRYYEVDHLSYRDQVKLWHKIPSGGFSSSAFVGCGDYPEDLAETLVYDQELSLDLDQAQCAPKISSPVESLVRDVGKAVTQ